MGKRIKRILLLICICLGVLCALFGCGEENSTGKFEKDGLSITLTSNFSVGQKEGYTAYYQSSQMVVATKKEPFASFENVTRDPSLCSTAEYVDDLEAEWYRKQGINSWQGGVIEENGLVYFTYEDDEFGDGFKVCCFGYKSADAFWSVRFGCEATRYEGLKKSIFDYAKTVKLNADFVETLAFEKIEGKEEYRLAGLGSVTALDIVVPAEYNGLPVTEIGGGAWGTKRGLIKSVVLPDSVTKIERGLFSSMYDLKRVQLGNAVTTIDEYAFQHSSYLEEVVLPDTVTTIGMEAFAYCYRLKNINLGNVQNVGVAAFFQCKALETLQIPKTMLSTGYSVFAGCEGLKSVTFPDTLQTIERASFQGCISLTEIVIPDSVTLIEAGAFDQCFALEKVTIPDSVTSIGISAFTSCDALQYTEYEDCLYLGNENNPYLYLAKPVSNQIGFGKTHAKTKIIAAKAFSDCNNLMQFEVGQSITEIGFLAFENCVKLLEIYNRSSLEIIAGNRETNGGIGKAATWVYTEAGQGGLLTDENGYVYYDKNEARILLGYNGTDTILQLPADITKISENAFYKRDDLQSITLGDSVQAIGEYAFARCGLETIRFNENVSDIAESAFYRSGVKTLDLPDSLTTIDKQAFAECTNLETLTFGVFVETIGEKAFSGCSALKKVEIPDSVLSMGTSAFGGCASLQEVIIGDGLQAKKIDWFGGCTALQTVVLGNGITIINETAFAWLNELKTVVLGDSVEQIGNRAFEDCTNLTEVTFGKSVKSIGYRAFQRTGISQILLPASLESIGSSAFSDCKNLTNITIPDLVKKIPNNIFDGCSGLQSVILGRAVEEVSRNAFRNCTNMTGISIPNGIVAIDREAFKNCQKLQYAEYENGMYLGNEENPYVALISCSEKEIQTATVHAKTTLISDYAFMNCEALTQVSLPNSLRFIGERAFGWCKSLKGVDVPDTVESIGNEVFAGCAKLADVKLSASLKSIGQSSFSYCTALTEISFPSSLETIGGYAFDACSKLEKIVLPRSVRSIGVMAFRSCKNLTSAILPSGLQTIESGTFWDCESLTEIVLPETVTTIGDLAFEACKALKKVYFMSSTINETAQDLMSKHEALVNVTVYLYSETEPAFNADGTAYNGNFWRYKDGVPIVWA